MIRVKRKLKGPPNPLFEKWLKEWRDEAKRKGSETHHCFGRALKSLKKFPFELKTGRDCCILENFGNKLCTMLDKRLEEYNRNREKSEDVAFAGSKSSQTCFTVTSPLRRQESESSDVSEDTEVARVTEVHTLSSEEESSESVHVNEVANKRKSCMDSPDRSIKLPRSRDNSSKSQVQDKKRSKVYLPAYRSGGYAILLTLLKSEKEMTKVELEKEAQQLCNASFKKSSSDSHYTAWSSMATLVKKGLVEKNGRPIRYRLTDKGRETAAQLRTLEKGESEKVSSNSAPYNEEEKSPPRRTNENVNFNVSFELNSRLPSPRNDPEFVSEGRNGDVAGQLSANTDTCAKPCGRAAPRKKKILEKEKAKSNDDCGADVETILLLPNGFDVVLYVDTQEIENKQNVSGDKIVRGLRRRNVNFEVKHLNVGDYLWVCRDRRSNRELVLPYIVERKRMDDLASSIKDGRFHEQKFRLKQCGIQHCIYLVEKYGNDCLRLGLPFPTLQQAISNTKVVDGFDVKLTNSNDESLTYLAVMTNFLTRIFKEKTLVSCSKKDLPPFNMSKDVVSLMSFDIFNKDSGKMRKFTVRNMLVKHLLQLNGVSVEKAKAIVKVYPTPKALMAALDAPGGEAAVANITCGALARSVGPALAKSIHQLYTSPTLT